MSPCLLGRGLVAANELQSCFVPGLLTLDWQVQCECHWSLLIPGWISQQSRVQVVDHEETSDQVPFKM